MTEAENTGAELDNKSERYRQQEQCLAYLENVFTELPFFLAEFLHEDRLSFEQLHGLTDLYIIMSGSFLRLLRSYVDDSPAYATNEGLYQEAVQHYQVRFEELKQARQASAGLVQEIESALPSLETLKEAFLSADHIKMCAGTDAYHNWQGNLLILFYKLSGLRSKPDAIANFNELVEEVVVQSPNVELRFREGYAQTNIDIQSVYNIIIDSLQPLIEEMRGIDELLEVVNIEDNRPENLEILLPFMLIKEWSKNVISNAKKAYLAIPQEERDEMDGMMLELKVDVNEAEQKVIFSLQNNGLNIEKRTIPEVGKGGYLGRQPSNGVGLPGLLVSAESYGGTLYLDPREDGVDGCQSVLELPLIRSNSDSDDST